MKRHRIYALLFALCPLGSVVIGHYVGRHRGERVVENRRSSLEAAAAASPRTTPPRLGEVASGPDRGSQAKSKTRAEVSRRLTELKKLMYQSSGATGSQGGVAINLNEAATAEALARWSLEEVRLALEIAAELAPGLDKYAYSMVLLQRWARENPEAALAHYEAHREEAGPFGSMWLHAVFTPWIEKDPVVAARSLAAVLSRESDNFSKGGVPNTVPLVAERLSLKDPAAAMQFVADLPEWARPSARTSVAKLVDGDGRAAFLDSLRRLPPGPDATDWQRVAAAAMAPVDPGAASRWIDSLGLSQEDTRETTRSVFEQWKHHDPQAAVEWAAGRLPPAEKTILMTRAVESWAPREPNECGRWLGRFEAAPEFDHAVAAFAQAIKSKDPGSARAWIGRITDPQIRDDAVKLLGP